MSEWWTYRISSFLLFSPRTYYRLFELYNAAIWPAQIVAFLLGLTILALAVRTQAGLGRWISGALAACWLFVAIAFHALRYATINWGAAYFAWLFGLEAALLVWTGVVRGRLRFERPRGVAGGVGLGLFLYAVMVEPIVGALLGRAWRAAEIFGVAPDPTAVATLGIVLIGGRGGRWMLMIAPVIWCAVTGVFLVAMRAPDAWIAPLAAVVAVVTAASQGLRAAKRAL